ncbi:MAG: outer membrane protein assembly factor BamD [Gammaproteobacteria bacterium]|nr:outer membrane protein assembly factor BamD [Gammaproteobacteria bacterium]
MVLVAALLAACASDGDKPRPINPFNKQLTDRELRLEAGALYKQARQALDSSDFAGAILRYDQILTRYPFTAYATQAQLEGVYARYRNFETENALSAADRFLKEHPRHEQVDYVYYLRGLINFQRGDSLFDGLPYYDPSKSDVSYARRAFDDFALLIQRFPGSRYVGDARARMVFLRNRLAQHELNVVKFYVRRGAHVAAIKRAEQIVAQYPGAPATLDALKRLEASYRELGMEEQAAEARRVLDANSAATPERG